MQIGESVGPVRIDPQVTSLVLEEQREWRFRYRFVNRVKSEMYPALSLLVTV